VSVFGPIEVKPLAVERLDEYLRFFDKNAFTDNPRWADCYCYFPYHDPAKTHWPERSGEAVGWCNAAPRRLFPMLHLGPLAMYLAAGFSIVREDDAGNVYVRKHLG